MNIFSKYWFKKSGFILKNRIALAPMTNTQSHEDGTLGDDEYRWLVRRAKEDFGMVITCASHVSKDGQGWPGELGIYSDDHLEGLSRLVNGIHEYNCLAIIQLFHGGARSSETVSGTQPWSASAHETGPANRLIKVREASIEDIDRVIRDFRNAAIRAHKAGFDGVELHGAHGYLLHQFLSTVTNQRTDKWGGNFENRAQLIRSILQEIRSELPSGFIIGVRISPEDKYTFQGIDFDESLELAMQLEADGADYIHLSPWDALKKPEKYPESDKLLIMYFREKLSKDTAIVVAGEIWTREDAETALKSGADIIALGRAAIGIPDWPHRAAQSIFIPQKPPYSVNHLKEADLGDSFIEYMRRWKDFVI
ncbi:MAG: NADH:flavin oxidoreductase [Saprospiraceae bacterium]|nr:NADH:flavin oxidoreductase [Saprospiraceae bacterium]